MKNWRRIAWAVAIVADLLMFNTGCVIDVVDVDAGYSNSNDVEASQTISTTVSVGDLESIRLAGGNGEVLIRGVPGVENIGIRAVKRVRAHSRRDAEEHLSLLRVDIRKGPRELGVETVQPTTSGGRTYLVDYEITVPRRFLVTVVNGNGTVWVEGIRADVDVKNGNGGINLTDVEGSTWVTLGNGQLHARILLPAGGVVSHAVGNGEIDLKVQPEVSAAFSAKVGNGVITMTGLTLSETVSEPRILQGVLGSGGGLIDLSVGNGTIQVRGS